MNDDSPSARNADNGSAVENVENRDDHFLEYLLVFGMIAIELEVGPAGERTTMANDVVALARSCDIPMAVDATSRDAGGS
jgi:hypothetical protein